MQKSFEHSAIYAHSELWDGISLWIKKKMYLQNKIVLYNALILVDLNSETYLWKSHFFKLQSGNCFTLAKSCQTSPSICQRYFLFFVWIILLIPHKLFFKWYNNTKVDIAIQLINDPNNIDDKLYVFSHELIYYLSFSICVDFSM